MTRSYRPAVRCPHAKPEDLCFLPPGVRYCLCYAEQHREHVAAVSVQGGQIFWCVPAGGRARGWYSYVAVVRQGTTAVPLELQDDAAIRETVEGGRGYYVVRGPRDQRYEIDAAALVEAAAEGKETVDAAPTTLH